MADTIRKFFADAGSNSIRAFYCDETGLGGYTFDVLNPRSSPGEDDSGRSYRLVTTCDVSIALQADGTRKILPPGQIEEERIALQFTLNEWFSGPFRGKRGRVAAVNIEEMPDVGESNT